MVTHIDSQPQHYLRLAIAQAETWWQRRRIQDTHRNSLALSLALWHSKMIGQIPSRDPLGIPDRVRDLADKFCRDILDHPDRDYSRVVYGDSLADFSREMLESEGVVPSYANFAIAGSRAHHMQYVFERTWPYLQGRVRVVVLGSLGGNGMLIGFDYGSILERSLDCMNTIRAAVGDRVRIALYSIPPTYSITANMYRPYFELDLERWMLSDPNAVLISFRKQGWFFPKIALSIDGVHWTSTGKLIFAGQVRGACQGARHRIIT